MAKIPKLRKKFPFRDLFTDFLEEYSESQTYWYIPKARTLSDDAIADIQQQLRIIFDEFLEEIWNPDTQDRLLARLTDKRILQPYKEGKKLDRTALTRIHKKLWEALGLLWVEENNEIMITDAGVDVIAAAEAGDPPRPIIENQIAKWQYPNPSVGDPRAFKGILPHLFLLQALQKLDYCITRHEFELFINLAQKQDDVARIVRYIKQWRDLSEEEQEELLEIVKPIPVFTPPSPQTPLWEDEGTEGEEEPPTRHRRIHLNFTYHRAFFSYPSYLSVDDDGNVICTSRAEVDTLIREKLTDLKIYIFKNKEDWFHYYGNPQQQPSWFTYLSLAIERAESREQAQQLVQEGQERLNKEELEQIKRKEIEKGIEDFYVERLALIEEGLKLLEEQKGDRKGRQYSTPIGAIDLLCLDRNGTYVIIEIKAIEARDSAFGQVLRYIGWVHRNLENGLKNARGIIIAAEFPEAARYSQIGLEPLTEDYKEFLRFKKHGLSLQDT